MDMGTQSYMDYMDTDYSDSSNWHFDLHSMEEIQTMRNLALVLDILSLVLLIGIGIGLVFDCNDQLTTIILLFVAFVDWLIIFVRDITEHKKDDDKDE